MRQWPEDERIRGTGERRTDGQTLPTDPDVTDRSPCESGETVRLLTIAVVDRRVIPIAAVIVVPAQAAMTPAARKGQGERENEEGERDSANHK